MCLGTPGQIVTVVGDVAVVESWGVRHDVSLADLNEPVFPGDYVIEHLGIAERKISSESVVETMAMYEVVLPEAGCRSLAIAEEETFEWKESLVLALV